MLTETIIQLPEFFEIPPPQNSVLNKKPPAAHPNEFVILSDETLCRHAQQGCAISRDLLWRRHCDFIRSILYRENARQQLPVHEIADALQESYFAFHLTMQQYNPLNQGHGKPASFKTFLALIVMQRFSNYCKQWRRYRHHNVGQNNNDSKDAVESEAEQARSFALYLEEENNGAATDEKAVLERKLIPEELAAAFCQLKPKEKHLLEVWLQHGRDKAVAEVMGISPAAAKLRRERLFRRIRENVATK